MCDAGFEVHTPSLMPQDFLKSYEMMSFALRYWGDPDLVFITGDRVEMCAAAACAFHNNVKIAHYYGGVVNIPVTTFDDVDRHCITLWAGIHFVESDECADVVADLRKNFHLINSRHNIHVVGISHMDDLEVDESLVPHSCFPDCHKQEYDLILMNGETIPLTSGWIWNHERHEIQIGSNPDKNIGKLVGVDTYYENLPRAQFLGLLKNCTRFITNSSCAWYEAPYFLKKEQIVMVGDRNKNRTHDCFEIGASDKIVKILKEIL
jgi:UDP-N-acetylglucosamine 2-epimerase